MLLLAMAAAHADVLPPQAAGASERFRNNPRAFDRYDTWCEGRSVQEACSIPGNAFEGGGAGVCKRSLHRTEFKIDLRCERTEQISMERGLPEGPWQVDEQMCKASSAAQLQSSGWVCERPPRLVDRFCTGQQAQSACKATLVIQGVSQSFEGVCQDGIQTNQIYFQGRRLITRPTLTCEPKTPTPAAPLKDVSALQKLWQ
jgi:hypothetical protein